MEEEKILTLHPQGKKGMNISREKYDLVRAAIFKELSGGRELTHAELVKSVVGRLRKRLHGSPGWYVEVVKLDLEARQEIRRLEGEPQRYAKG